MSARPPGYHPMLMSTGVRASALRTPERVAVSTAERAVTYAELVDRFDRIASLALDGLGLRRGDRVALFLPNGLELVELVLALSEQGIVPALLSAQATAAELAHVVADCGARVLFTRADLAARVAEAELSGVERVVTVGAEYEGLLAAARPGQRPPGADETDLYALHYTSGTTGRPKGVMLAHRCRTFHMLVSMGANQGIYQPGVRALAVAPLFNGAGFVGVVAPIWFGGSVHIVERFDAAETLALIESRRATTAFMVPTHFHAIFALDPEVLARHDVSSLRAIAVGAAALPQETKECIVAHFGEGRLFEGYGSTEAGGITSLRPEDQLRKPHCAGLPLAGCEVVILDEDGAPVPEGEVGEIVVRSPWLFQGYWNDPAATADVLRDGWYHSGDLGRRDAEGYVSVVGRRKNVIVTGGQNVYPREVEEVLLRHPGVAEAAIVGRPDPYWGEAVAGFVVPAAGARLDGESLRAWCREHLSGYKIPKTVTLVDALPRNDSGKVQHRALLDRLDGAPP